MGLGLNDDAQRGLLQELNRCEIPVLSRCRR